MVTRDLRSGIRKKPIPGPDLNPGVKKVPDPGSATLESTGSVVSGPPLRSVGSTRSGRCSSVPSSTNRFSYGYLHVSRKAFHMDQRLPCSVYVDLLVLFVMDILFVTVFIVLYHFFELCCHATYRYSFITMFRKACALRSLGHAKVLVLHSRKSNL